MNFIRRIGRDEIYIKYVHQLVNVSPTTVTAPFLADFYADAPPGPELCRSRSHT